MSRTIDDIEREIAENADEITILRSKIEPFQNEMNKLCKHRHELRKEKEDWQLAHGNYSPMSDLLKYVGKRLSLIKLVVKNEDDLLRTLDLFGGEEDVLTIVDDGHIYYSSYECGVIRYDQDKKQYRRSFHYTYTWYDFVGFMNLKLEDED